jgi:hypothetical protein
MRLWSPLTLLKIPLTSLRDDNPALFLLQTSDLKIIFNFISFSSFHLARIRDCYSLHGQVGSIILHFMPQSTNQTSSTLILWFRPIHLCNFSPPGKLLYLAVVGLVFILLILLSMSVSMLYQPTQLQELNLMI